MRVAGRLTGQAEEAERAINRIDPSSSQYRVGHGLGRVYTATWVWRAPVAYTKASAVAGGLSCVTEIIVSGDVASCAVALTKAGFGAYINSWASGISEPVLREFFNACTDWLLDGV